MEFLDGINVLIRQTGCTPFNPEQKAALQGGLSAALSVGFPICASLAQQGYDTDQFIDFRHQDMAAELQKFALLDEDEEHPTPTGNN